MECDSDCLIRMNVPFIISKGFVNILNLTFVKQSSTGTEENKSELSYCILISSHSLYCYVMPACLVCHSYYFDRKIYDTVNCRR